MNVDECILQGLLKKGKPDMQMALNSMKAAEHKLGIAQRELDAKIHETAIISAYAAMFHAGRALLYKDGFKERSHYAISVYIGEKYGSRLEQRFIHELDTLRSERHTLMYSIEELPDVSKAEAESALSVAQEFVSAIRKLL